MVDPVHIHITKASLLFESKESIPRITLLLRLPPPSVQLTPEVRCAVVGNVDSGKSTTLGVLTRGYYISISIESGYLITVLQVLWTMAEGELGSLCSDTNTKLRAGERPVLEWKYVDHP